MTRKERKSGKKIFYVESSGQNGLHYLMLQNNVQKLQYFCDLAANAAEKLVRQKSAKLRHAAEKSPQGCQRLDVSIQRALPPARSYF